MSSQSSETQRVRICLLLGQCRQSSTRLSYLLFTRLFTGTSAYDTKGRHHNTLSTVSLILSRLNWYIYLALARLSISGHLPQPLLHVLQPCLELVLSPLEL